VVTVKSTSRASVLDGVANAAQAATARTNMHRFIASPSSRRASAFGMVHRTPRDHPYDEPQGIPLIAAAGLTVVSQHRAVPPAAHSDLRAGSAAALGDMRAVLDAAACLPSGHSELAPEIWTGR
jgi:hypothetical protein